MRSAVHPFDIFKQRKPVEEKPNVRVFFPSEKTDTGATDIKKTGLKIIDGRAEHRINRAEVLQRLQFTVPEIRAKTAISIVKDKAPAPTIQEDEEERELVKQQEPEQQELKLTEEKETEPKETEEQQQEPKETEEQQTKPKQPTIKKSVKRQKTEEKGEPKEKEPKETGDEEQEKPGKPEEEKELRKTSVEIGEKIKTSDIKKSRPNTVRVSPYYLNNRKLFLQNLTKLFAPYRESINANMGEISCKQSGQTKFELLTHQYIVREYLNVYSPYRGLLLFHGLGSGKTCSSIAIAEGMKSEKRIVLMTPASLKMNFFSELKKCGDELYRKNQHWEFVSVSGQPDMVKTLSNKLNLSRKYITDKGGAWVMNVKKPANFDTFSENDQKSIDKQLDAMIRMKYIDLNYNGGITTKKWAELTTGPNGELVNPFDHSVVVIDEAHNLVSRIVNSLGKPKSISYQIYDALMDASDVRIVLLSGTPIINYPHEIGVLFNILRGYIKTWTFPLRSNEAHINRDNILQIFKSSGFNTYDYVEYSGNNLVITRNPFGFVNTYSGDKRMKKGGRKTRKMKKNAKSSKTRRNNVDEPDNNIDESENNNDTDENDQQINIQYDNPYGEDPREDPRNLDKPEDFFVGGGVFEDYAGVRLDETGNISDTDFQRQIISTFAREGIQVVGKIPDDVYQNHVMRELERNGIPVSGILSVNASEKGKETFIKKVEKFVESKGHAVASIKTTDFQDRVNELLKKIGVPISVKIVPERMKCLPDDKTAFYDMFVNTNTGEVINIDVFKRRILGLTSYFRSAQEQLLPDFVKTSGNELYHTVNVEMSDYQFELYNAIRAEEREKEAQNKKQARRKNLADALDSKISSSYRIFSRSACNFAFPAEYTRPLPSYGNDKELSINDLNGIAKKRKNKDTEEDENENEDEEDTEENADEENEGEEEKDKDDSFQQQQSLRTYTEQIEAVLQKLKYDPSKPREKEFLTTEGLQQYSPKFLRVLENLQNEENDGLHLIYSQFRTLEGIGILKLVLEANGFAEFKLKRATEQGKTSVWTFDVNPEDKDKPKFVLYTGTETAEEKEIIRNIYNSSWDFVPSNIVAKMQETWPDHKNNHNGEIIRVFMITSSGSEGINLRNTRFVHVLEPYWNMTRINQVVGRARRICSHEDLPKEKRTVKVFIYMSVLTDAQKTDKNNIELRIKDVSKLDGKTPLTTDESLYEIANIKDGVNKQILKAIKESSIDCTLFNNNPDEPLVCYSYGQITTNDYGSFPRLETDLSVKHEHNVKAIEWTARKITDPKTKIQYALHVETGKVYDLATYEQAKATNGRQQPVLVGKLIKLVKTVNGKKVSQYELDFL